MAHSGEELFDPVRGQRIVFRKTAQETNGEVVEVETVYQPSSVVPPAHFHPLQEEIFEVLVGSIHTSIDGQERVYHQGERFQIPAGVVHEMWNAGKSEARLLWQTRPALRTEDFFEIIFGLAQDGKTNSAGVPNLLQIAVIMQHYRQEFRLGKPPLIVQNIVFTLLAPIGHILGYRATYPRKTVDRELIRK